MPHFARILAAFVCACALAAPARAAEQQTLCEERLADVPSSSEGVPGAIATRVDRTVRTATALVRFHRAEEAAAKLDRLSAFVDGPAGERVDSRLRALLITSLHSLRDCLADAELPALADVTVRPTLAEAGDITGAYVDVEGIRIGRTGSNGTLQAKVPSGQIHIEVTDYPSSWGEALVTIAPGASRVVSVPLDDSKEPSEDSDLVLEEAPDGLLPPGPASLTLKFVQDDEQVAVARVESIELWDSSGKVTENFDKQFRVRGGAIAASDAPTVYRRIAGHRSPGRPMSLFVYAVDSDGRNHYGTVAFALAQWKLRVQLAAPPSNPELPLAGIDVRVSVVGSDAALSRVSDAQGRLEIDALPDAVIALDSMTIAAGVYYYGQATTTLCGDREITLVMRNVKDVVAGVPALTVDPASPPCPPLPRR